MDILNKIADSTRKRIAAEKIQVTQMEMQQRAQKRAEQEKTPVFPFEAAIRKPGVSLICEIKKASPSKGLIADSFPYLAIAKEYERGGASAISVLTEPEYFQGSSRYLQEISQHCSLPLLRKDFTLDTYQIYEAKCIGASAILLICALLTQKELEDFRKLAESLGMSALVEAHDEEEIQKATAAGARIIGVNNRNLRTFQVDIQHSLSLRDKVPKSVLFVSESGMKTADDIRQLAAHQVDAALLGESLMRASDKAALLQELLGR